MKFNKSFELPWAIATGLQRLTNHSGVTSSTSRGGDVNFAQSREQGDPRANCPGATVEITCYLGHFGVEGTLGLFPFFFGTYRLVRQSQEWLKLSSGLGNA